MTTEWINKRTKSVLSKTVITVTGNKDGIDVPINLTIEALEFNYGPVIHITIVADNPIYKTSHMEWDDHPFLYVKGIEKGDTYRNIIDDTTATRAIINELTQNTDKTLYTTTHCTHVGRLISALSLFWS